MHCHSWLWFLHFCRQSHLCWLLLSSILLMQPLYNIFQRASPPTLPCKFHLKSTITISKCFLFTSLNDSFSISSCYNDLCQDCLAQSQCCKAPSPLLYSLTFSVLQPPYCSYLPENLWSLSTAASLPQSLGLGWSSDVSFSPFCSTRPTTVWSVALSHTHSLAHFR